MTLTASSIENAAEQVAGKPSNGFMKFGGSAEGIASDAVRGQGASSRPITEASKGMAQFDDATRASREAVKTSWAKSFWARMTGMDKAAAEVVDSGAKFGSRAAMKTSGKVVARGLGGAASAAIEAGGDAYSLATTDTSNEIGAREAQELGAKVIGKAAVGVGSAALGGAVAGAAIGSVVPVVGTAIGCVVGGLAAWGGSKLIDRGVEAGAEAYYGETDQQQLARVSKEQELAKWKSHHEGYQKGVADLLEIQKSISSYEEKKENSTPAMAEVYQEEITRKQEELRAKTIHVFGVDGDETRPGLEGEYQNYLKGLKETKDMEGNPYITEAKYFASMQSLTQIKENFAREFVKAGANAESIAGDAAMTQTSIEAKGDGEVSKDEVEMMQALLKDAGFQAGKFGVNKDGVDGVYGEVTGSSLDRFGDGDGIVEREDVMKMREHFQGKKQGDNYVLGDGITIDSTEFDAMLDDFSNALEGNATFASIQQGYNKTQGVAIA